MTQTWAVRRARLRKLGNASGPSALAAAGQAIGLAQIALIFFLHRPGAASDAYFYILGWTTLPTQILILGVLYPQLLRDGTAARRLVLWWASASGASIIGGLLALAVYGWTRPLFPGIQALFLSFCLMSAVYAAGWIAAVARAARGSVLLLSGITCISNLLGLAAVAAVGRSGSLLGALIAMIVAQSIGMACTLAVSRLGTRVYESIEGSGNARRSDAAWFLAQAMGGYGAGLALQSIALSVPGAALTYLGIVTRVASGLNTVVTNAIVPRLIHARTDKPDSAFLYITRTLTIAALLAFIALAAYPILGPLFTGIAIATLSWFAATAVNATARRLALRFLSPPRASVSIVSSVLVPILVAIVAHMAPGLSVLLVGYVALDLLPGLILLWQLDQRRLASIACGLLIIMVVGSCALVTTGGM